MTRAAVSLFAPMWSQWGAQPHRRATDGVVCITCNDQEPHLEKSVYMCPHELYRISGVRVSVDRSQLLDRLGVICVRRGTMVEGTVSLSPVR